MLRKWASLPGEVVAGETHVYSPTSTRPIQAIPDMQALTNQEEPQEGHF